MEGVGRGLGLQGNDCAAAGLVAISHMQQSVSHVADLKALQDGAAVKGASSCVPTPVHGARHQLVRGLPAGCTWCICTASSGLTCCGCMKPRGSYAPTGMALQSKGPSSRPISRNAGQ